MVWACMAVTGSGLVVFIGNIPADCSCRVNSEVYSHIYSDPTKCLKANGTVLQDSDPKLNIFHLPRNK